MGRRQGNSRTFPARHQHLRGPQQTLVDLIAFLHDLEHGVRRDALRGDEAQGFVLVGVKRLADGIDLADAGSRERLVDQAQRGALPVEQSRLAGFLSCREPSLDAVANGQDRLRQPFGAELARGVELPRAALAEIVELRRRPEVTVAMLVRLAPQRLELRTDGLGRLGFWHLFRRVSVSVHDNPVSPPPTAGASEYSALRKWGASRRTSRLGPAAWP